MKFFLDIKRKLPFLDNLNSNTKRSKNHVEEKTLPSICIDRFKGIFMVAAAHTGLSAPIHVQSHKRLQVKCCSNQACMDIMMNPFSLNPALECVNLKSVVTAKVAKVIDLITANLDCLVNLQLISKNTQQRCLDLHAWAAKNDIPLVVHANFADFGQKERFMYFSVYIGSEDFFFKFYRVRVTFDSHLSQWSCKCPISTERFCCLHEAIAKWYLIQIDAAKLNDCTRYVD